MPHSHTKANPRSEMFCSYCGQGFKRDEHLERHILTHTNIRPFRCRECKLAFKRKDLLRRHYRSIHAPPTEDDNAQNDDDATPTRTGAVGRIPIACANCAQSKTKCDNQMPCSRCVKKNLTCERRTFRRSSCKDNPKPYGSQDTQQKSPRKSIEEDTIPEEQEEEEEESIQPEEKPIVSTTPEEQLPVYPTTSIDQPPFVVPQTLPLNVSDTMSAPMVHPLHVMTDMNFPQFFPDIQPNMFQDQNFDMFMDDVVSSEPLTGSNTSMWSARSDATLSDSEWSLLQDDLKKLSTTSMPVTDTCSQWPFFRCNPSIGEGIVGKPTTALASLKALESPDFWLRCAPPSAKQPQDAPAGRSLMSQCDPSTRDRLLAVTQQIWRISRERVMSVWTNEQADAWMERIILLPPTTVLNQILEQRVSLEGQYFHLLPIRGSAISASFTQSNQLLSGILTLLIIAQVTRASVAGESRALSGGLVEVCRLVIQDAETEVTPEFLEASLSLLQLLQWSGESMHMAAVLKLWGQHAKSIQKEIFASGPDDGLLLSDEPRASTLGIENSNPTDSELRMLHAWLAVDLELSLFHDIPPKLAVQDVASPGFSPMQFKRRFTSLTALFEKFMGGQLSSHGGFTASSLRLLLHPLQCLSAHLHQCLDTFGSIQQSSNNLNSTLGLASKAFIDELGMMLRRWHHLATALAPESAQNCPIMRESLTLYHIMALNNISSFPEVEMMIRENPTGGPNLHVLRSWMRTSAPDTTALLLYHCGQCLGTLRSMTAASRPLWWAAALYRITLILCQAVISNSANGLASGFDTAPNHSTPIIVLDKDCTRGSDNDVMMQMFLTRLQGTPVLTKSDGSTMLLGVASEVLDYCITLLEEHMAFDKSTFTNGVRIKLGALRSRWGESAGLRMI